MMKKSKKIAIGISAGVGVLLLTAMTTLIAPKAVPQTSTDQQNIQDFINISQNNIKTLEYLINTNTNLKFDKKQEMLENLNQIMSTNLSYRQSFDKDNITQPLNIDINKDRSYKMKYKYYVSYDKQLLYNVNILDLLDLNVIKNMIASCYANNKIISTDNLKTQLIEELSNKYDTNSQKIKNILENDKDNIYIRDIKLALLKNNPIDKLLNAYSKEFNPNDDKFNNAIINDVNKALKFIVDALNRDWHNDYETFFKDYLLDTITKNILTKKDIVKNFKPSDDEIKNYINSLKDFKFRVPFLEIKRIRLMVDSKDNIKKSSTDGNLHSQKYLDLDLTDANINLTYDTNNSEWVYKDKVNKNVILKAQLTDQSAKSLINKDPIYDIKDFEKTQIKKPTTVFDDVEGWIKYNKQLNQVAKTYLNTAKDKTFLNNVENINFKELRFENQQNPSDLIDLSILGYKIVKFKFNYYFQGEGSLNKSWNDINREHFKDDTNYKYYLVKNDVDLDELYKYIGNGVGKEYVKTDYENKLRTIEFNVPDDKWKEINEKGLIGLGINSPAYVKFVNAISDITNKITENGYDINNVYLDDITPITKMPFKYVVKVKNAKRLSKLLSSTIEVKLQTLNTIPYATWCNIIDRIPSLKKEISNKNGDSIESQLKEYDNNNYYSNTNAWERYNDTNEYKLVNLITKDRYSNDFNDKNIVNYKDLPLDFEKINSQKDNVVFLKYVSSKDQLPYEYQYFDSSFSAGNLLKDDKGDSYYIRQVLIAKELFLPEDFRFNKKVATTDINYNVFKDLGSYYNYNNHINYSNWIINQPNVNSFEDYEKRVGQEQLKNDIQWLKAVQYWLRLLFLTTSVTAKSYSNPAELNGKFVNFFLPKKGYYSDGIWAWYKSKYDNNADWHNWSNYWQDKNIWKYNKNNAWDTSKASYGNYDFFDIYTGNYEDSNSPKDTWEPRVGSDYANYGQPFRNLISHYTHENTFPFQGIFNFQALNKIESNPNSNEHDETNNGKTNKYPEKINSILTGSFSKLQKKADYNNIWNTVADINKELEDINIYELGYHWYWSSKYLTSYWRPLYKDYDPHNLYNKNLTLYDLINMPDTKSSYSYDYNSSAGKYCYSNWWFITKAIFNKDFSSSQYSDKIDDVYKELGFYNSDIISWLRSAMENRFNDSMTNKVKKLLDLYSDIDYKNMLNANNCVLEDWKNNKFNYWYDKDKAFTFFKKIKELFNSELYNKFNNESINDFINKHSYYFDKNINWASDKGIDNQPNDPKKQLDLDNNNDINWIYGQNHNTNKLYPYFNNSIFWKYKCDDDYGNIKNIKDLSSFYIPEEMVDKYNTIVDNFRYNYDKYLTFNKNNDKNYYDQDIKDLYKVIFREMFKLLATNEVEYGKFRDDPNKYIIKYISNFDKPLLQKIQIDNLKSEIKQLKAKFDNLLKDAIHLDVDYYYNEREINDNWNKINSNNLNDLTSLKNTINKSINLLTKKINEKKQQLTKIQQLKNEIYTLKSKFDNLINEAENLNVNDYNSQWRVDDNWDKIYSNSLDDLIFLRDTLNDVIAIITSEINEKNKANRQLQELKAELKNLEKQYRDLLSQAEGCGAYTDNIKTQWNRLSFDSNDPVELKNIIKTCKELIQELKNKIAEAQETEDTGTDNYGYREARSVISRFANFEPTNNQDLINTCHKLNIFNLLWYLDNHFVNDFKTNSIFNKDIFADNSNKDKLTNEYYLDNKYLLAHDFNPNSLFYTFNQQHQHKLKILKKEFNKTNISDNITNKQEIFNAIKQRIENFNNSNAVNKNYSSKFNDNKHSDRYYINTNNLINNDPELQEFINRIDNIISDDDNRGNEGLMLEELNKQLLETNEKDENRIINPNNDIDQNQDDLTFKQWLDNNLYYHLNQEIDYLNYYKEYNPKTEKWIDLKKPEEFDVEAYKLFTTKQDLISNRIYYKNRLWKPEFKVSKDNQIIKIKLTQLNHIELSSETIDINNQEVIKKVLAKININILRDLINTFLNIKSSNNSDFYNMLDNLSYISSWLTRDLQYYNNSSTKNPCFDNSNKVWYPNMNLLREFRQKHRLYDIDEDDLKTFIMEFITKNNFIKKLKINSLLNYQTKQNNTSNTDNKDQKSTETSSQEIINQYIIDFVKGVYKTNSVDNVYYKYDNMPNQWTMYLENNAIANLTDISNQLHYKKYDFNGMQKYSKGYLNNQALYYKQLLESYDGIEFLNKKLYNNNADYKDDINNDYLISSIIDYIITKSKSKSKNRLYSKIMSDFKWDNDNFKYCQIEDYGIGNVYNDKKNNNYINKYIKLQNNNNNYFGIYDNVTNEMLWNMYNDNNPVKENEIVMQINTEILNDYLNLTNTNDDIKGSRLPKVRKTLIKINKDYLVTYGNYKFQFIYRHKKFGDLLFTIAVCYDKDLGQYYKLYVGDKNHIATKNNVIDDIKYLNNYIGNIKNNNDIKKLSDYKLNFNLTKKTDKITKYDIEAKLVFNKKVKDNDPAWTASSNETSSYNKVNLEYYEHIWLEALKNNKIKFINQINITDKDIETFISKNINKDQSNANYAQNYLDLANNLGIYMFINNRILNLYNIVFDLKTMQEHHRLAFKDYANMWSYQEILKEFEVYEKLMLKIGDLGAILTYKNIVYFKQTLRAFDYIIKDNQFLDIEEILMANTTKAISEVIKTAFIYIKNNLNALNKLFNEFNKLNILDKSKVLVGTKNIKEIRRNLYQEYTNINSLVIDKKNLVNVDKNKTKTLLEFSLRNIDLVRNNNGEIIEQTSDLDLSGLYKLYNNIINSLEVAYCLNNNNKYKANLLLNNLVKAIYEYKTTKPYDDIGQLNEVNLAYFSDIYKEISENLKHYEYQYRPSSEFNHSYGSFILTPKTTMEDFEKYKSIKDDDLSQSNYVPNKQSAKEYDFSNTNGIEGFEYNKSNHRSFDISSDNNDGNSTSTPYDNLVLKSAEPSPDDVINTNNSLDKNKSKFEYDTTTKNIKQEDYTYKRFKGLYDQLLEGDILIDFMKSSFTLPNIKKINKIIKEIISRESSKLNLDINVKGIKGNISGCELFRMMTSLYYNKLTDQNKQNKELEDLQQEFIEAYCKAIINYWNFYNNDKLNKNIKNEINQQFKNKLDGNYLLNNKAMRLKNRHNVFLNNIAIGQDNLLTTLTKYIRDKINNNKANTDYYKNIDRLLVIYNQAKNMISGFDSSQNLIIQGQNTAYEAGLDNFDYNDILTSLKNTNLFKLEQEKKWVSTWFTYNTNILDAMANSESNFWLRQMTKTFAMAYSGHIETITGLIKLCYNLNNQQKLQEIKNKLEIEIQHNTDLINDLSDNNVKDFINNNIFKNMTTALQKIDNNLNIGQQVVDILISIAKMASGISVFNAIFRNPNDWHQANDYMLQYNLGLDYGLWYNLDNVGLFNYSDSETSKDITYNSINITYVINNTYGSYYKTYKKLTNEKTIYKENLFKKDDFDIQTTTSGWSWSHTYFDDANINKYINLFNLYNIWSNKNYNLKKINGNIKTTNNEYKNNDEYLNIELLNK